MDSEHHVKDRKYVQHKSVKRSCASAQFQALSFCVPNSKTHGGIGLSRNYHLQLEPKLCHGKCEIRRIRCTCISCKDMLDKPWVRGSEPTSQPRYQPVEYCTYWPVLGYFNNWNIIKFTNKTTKI